MTSKHLLLDASIWVAAEIPGERSAMVTQELVLDTHRRTAALDLTLYEVANAIGAKRGDAVGAAVACRSIELRCRENFVCIDSELIKATAKIAVEHGLTSYDAAYVAVSRREGWTLISLDIKDLVSKGLAITPDAAV
jgi:predicted nucleic acid-binding protein